MFTISPISQSHLVTRCPFRKFHPAWESRREPESSHDLGRCLQPCTCSGCSSSTCSSRAAGLKPRTCSFVINSASDAKPLGTLGHLDISHVVNDHLAARLMTSIASWQVAHPALYTSIFRLAAISLVPSILALPRLKDGRWERDGTRYPLELPPRSSVEWGLKRRL